MSYNNNKIVRETFDLINLMSNPVSVFLISARLVVFLTNQRVCYGRVGGNPTVGWSVWNECLVVSVESQNSPDLSNNVQFVENKYTYICSRRNCINHSVIQLLVRKKFGLPEYKPPLTVQPYNADPMEKFS